MEENNGTIPINIVRCIIGYFNKTLSESEKDILDTWICESEENQKVFEDFVMLVDKCESRPLLNSLN